MKKITDVCVFSKRGTTKGDLLHWATNRGGRYILHTVVASNGRRLDWEDTKRTINQVLIRDRNDAIEMLLSGRYATRMRDTSGESANLFAPKSLMFELDDGTVVSLAAARAACLVQSSHVAYS
jgi:hypothetical protein